jgi:hypothetical protein
MRLKFPSFSNSAFIGFGWTRGQTAITSPHTINKLLFTIDSICFYIAIGDKYENLIHFKVHQQSDKHFTHKPKPIKYGTCVRLMVLILYSAAKAVKIHAIFLISLQSVN